MPPPPPPMVRGVDGIRGIGNLRGLRGLGQSTSGGGNIEADTAAAGAIGSAIPVAGPFIAAAAAIGVSIEKLFSGCGSTCTEATSIANQVGDLLTQNAQAYVNSPIRTTSMQSAALQVFNNAWAQLVQACSNPQLGTAGQNCISQRQQGGCQWKSSPGGWTQNADGTCTYTWAGAVGSGDACWNYFVGMYDPIANDPCVVPDSEVSGTSATTSTGGTVTASGTMVTPTNNALTGATTTSTTTSTPTTSDSLIPVLVIGAGLLVLMELL